MCKGEPFKLQIKPEPLDCQYGLRLTQEPLMLQVLEENRSME